VSLRSVLVIGHLTSVDRLFCVGNIVGVVDGSLEGDGKRLVCKLEGGHANNAIACLYFEGCRIGTLTLTISSGANFLSNLMVGLLASNPPVGSKKQMVVLLVLGQAARYLAEDPPNKPGSAVRLTP
jgi:hypothetical protein